MLRIDPRLLYEWFVVEGWQPILVCTIIIIQVRNFFFSLETRRRTSAVEFKYSGLLERVINVNHEVSRVKRATGSFSPVKPEENVGNNDPTHIKDT